VDGVDYRFLSKPHFMEMVNRCEFLEWKEVHGNLYGTAVTPILQAVEAGRPVILDIDVEGAKEVFSKHASAVGIFIKPPNLAALEQRLRGRGTDSGDAIGLRIKNAEREMEAASEFKYQVVNDDLESAVNELADIIRKEWTHENDAPGEFGKERPLD
jgi:guanylate kinase